jgi:hypothetical protein
VFLRIITLFLVTFATLQFNCGGGSDVGNPDISGHISSTDGSPVMTCTVILGPRNCDPGTVDTVKLSNEIIIHLYHRPFDTVKTDQNGNFTFSNIEPGEYSVLAKKDNLLGICKIDHQKDFDSDMNIELTYASKLTIDNYSSAMDTSPKAFVTARISGTPITPHNDIKDRLYFSAVPPGVFDIILYRNNRTVDYINDLDVQQNDSVTIQVNPDRKPQEWTYKQGTRNIHSRPYVLAYNFKDVLDSTLYNINYDCWIQFSHDMDTRMTGDAISVFSSDSLVSINRLHWEGSNMLYIDLCVTGTAPCADENASLKKGVIYSIAIDTTASTTLGYKLAWPDTITLTP